jgi:hypothetical protein
MNDIAINIITTIGGGIIGAISTFLVSWYNKKRDVDLQEIVQKDSTVLKTKEMEDITAPERAFALLERLVIQQQKEFEQLKDFHYEEVKKCQENTDRLNARIDGLIRDHQECMLKHAASEVKIEALTKIVSKYESQLNCPNK